jgi:flagellar hook assembly protein FlgD
MAALPYSIKIYNLRGVLLKTLSNQNQWDGKNEQNRLCEGGVYLYRIEGQKQHVSGQVVLIR